MITTIRKRQPHVTSYFYIWLLLGTVLVCLVPALLLPNWRVLLMQQGGLLNGYSVAMVAAAFLFSSLTLQRMNWFPGERSRFIGISVLLAWYGMLMVILLLLRLPYSLEYLALGCTISMIWQLVHEYKQKTAYRLCLAYVPLGRAESLGSLQNVQWVRLETPNLPDSVLVDGIVADLHATGLTRDWQKFLAECALQHMPVYNVRQMQEALTGRIRIQHMYENDLGSLLPSASYMAIKRIWETALVMVSMPVVLPVMVIAGIAIKLESEGSMLFLQQRVGQSGKEFTIYKFRSMGRDSEKDGAQFAQAGDMRVTRVGKFIRKTRIDELPQFFNVIKGDMALIGPRPEQKAFVDQFEHQIPFYNYRHIVKPGITGWAQVMHGYAANADETQVKTEHDFYYIKYFSFGLDFLVALKTVYTMLTGFGAR